MKTKLSIFVLLMCSLIVEGQQTNEKFVVETDYLLYLPEGYKNDTTQRWPLMLFLHGAGEQGTDLNKVKVHGPPMLVEKGQKFPFIIVSPQANRGWNTTILYNLLQDLIVNKRVDTERIYLTGLSMGGFGTWKLATEHPEMFAAIVPICGGGDSKEVWKLRHIPVWCFHGAKDNIVPLASSEKMVNALREYNPDVKFTVYPEESHESWKKAYEDPKLYEWLLKQKKFHFTEVEVTPSVLESYEGEYLFKRENFEAVLRIYIEDGKLMGDIKGKQYELKPASPNTFFIENQMVEFKFQPDANGKVDEIRLFDNEIVDLKRIK